MIKTLSIVIPVYNEGNTFVHILDKIKKTGLVNNINKQIVIVNDCSTDNTEETALQYIAANPDLDILYFKHQKNLGKGAALHTGIQKASGEYLIIQDADLEYDPADYNALLKPIVEGFAEM